MVDHSRERHVTHVNTTQKAIATRAEISNFQALPLDRRQSN